jgi:hypothetical protein
MDNVWEADSASSGPIRHSVISWPATLPTRSIHEDETKRSLVCSKEAGSSLLRCYLHSGSRGGFGEHE